MKRNDRKGEMSRFPLRLLPSVRRPAETCAEEDGVSLNQFINIAVAEKVARREHERWLKRRRPSTPESRARALAILHRGGTLPPEPWDRLPEGYVSAFSRPKFGEPVVKTAPERHGKKLTAQRLKVTPELIADALRLLSEGGDNPPQPGDELPEGYVSAFPRPRLKKAATAAETERRGKKVAAK